MDITGIPLLDSVIEMFPWDKSKEYKKIVKRYGPEVKDILVELILKFTNKQFFKS